MRRLRLPPDRPPACTAACARPSLARVRHVQAVCTSPLSLKTLTSPPPLGTAVNMEAAFSQLTLDIIGKSVFNYDFNALTKDSPVIQVRGCTSAGA